MPDAIRKPLTSMRGVPLPIDRPASAPIPMESRTPRSIRFKPSEWESFEQAARDQGVEVTRYVRECALTGHAFSLTRDSMKEYRRGTP